jgi:hypothetical protein
MKRSTNKQDWTNEDFMHDIMNFSPFGALCQGFIIQAIEYYCDEVISQKDDLLAQDAKEVSEGKIRIISTPAWIGIAEDIKSRIVEKYHAYHKTNTQDEN